MIEIDYTQQSLLEIAVLTNNICTHAVLTLLLCIAITPVLTVLQSSDTLQHTSHQLNKAL